MIRAYVFVPSYADGRLRRRRTIQKRTALTRRSERTLNSIPRSGREPMTIDMPIEPAMGRTQDGQAKADRPMTTAPPVEQAAPVAAWRLRW